MKKFEVILLGSEWHFNFLESFWLGHLNITSLGAPTSHNWSEIIFGPKVFFSPQWQPFIFGRFPFTTAWKAKCPIFKAKVAGFRGKVASKHSTLGVPGGYNQVFGPYFVVMFFPQASRDHQVAVPRTLGFWWSRYGGHHGFGSGAGGRSSGPVGRLGKWLKNPWFSVPLRIRVTWLDPFRLNGRTFMACI